MSYWRYVLDEDMSYRRMLFWGYIAGRICLTGGHALLEKISYTRTCLTGWHVLLEDMSCGRTYYMLKEDYFGDFPFLFFFFVFSFPPHVPYF